MAKKKRKKQEDLPEGMSRRQAKMAARAKEREALQKDPRPFGGLAAEAELIALQEFVPSASAKFQVNGEDVTVATVLPGAAAAMVREEAQGGERLVALQVGAHSQNPGRDLAYALSWVLEAEPGETLQSTAADGSQPELKALIDATFTPEITVHNDFNWWFAEGEDVPAQLRQAMNQANGAVWPSAEVSAGVPGAVWWVNPGGGKAHIRWIRTEDNESQVLNALARIAAKGELVLGEGTKFAGAFRTHGVVVPVWDLDPEVAPESYAEALKDLNVKLEAELANDAQLTAAERKQLDNIKSRQVTI
ncbi:preprotein translocase subunit SecA [Corynebacterium godavarianum]|uniref:Preprotein translocase subunit SecA n=1 Tax=Corynebacterium godavarianum TaxID=2054421 RepID=A0ABY3E2I9_9CORY|nr:DUF5926 family protein [Corynebacterium godavarianum]MBL7286848.1 preprotein translocase subunit SecA [Corynebacterium godavarianum]TSJ73755.1 preprotein translocase subunit SecA [Corynebacterium godavarianum]